MPSTQPTANLAAVFSCDVRGSCSPSSTTTARFPSGDRPTQVMFLAVEMGRVSEVLLEDTRQYDPLSFIYVHVTRDAIK